MLQIAGKEREGRHSKEADHLLRLLEDTKQVLREERDKVKKIEEKAAKENSDLTIQVRELQAKLRSARIREEEQ